MNGQLLTGNSNSATAEIYEDAAGEWRWRVKAANGEIIAHGESYTRHRDAVRGLGAAVIAFQSLTRESDSA